MLNIKGRASHKKNRWQAVLATLSQKKSGNTVTQTYYHTIISVNCILIDALLMLTGY